MATSLQIICVASSFHKDDDHCDDGNNYFYVASDAEFSYDQQYSAISFLDNLSVFCMIIVFSLCIIMANVAHFQPGDPFGKFIWKMFSRGQCTPHRPTLFEAR